MNLLANHDATTIFTIPHKAPNASSWLAVANKQTLDQPNLSGSQACRLLLVKLLAYCRICGELITDKFPYRLITKTTHYFVSFSHSVEQVAVLVSLCPNIGIDIEDKEIKTAVAKRYFSQAEQAWLEKLPIAQQRLGRSLLWTLKESWLKQQNCHDSRLLKGIKTDMLALFNHQQLTQLLAPTANISYIKTEHYLIGFMPTYYCSVIIACSP